MEINAIGSGNWEGINFNRRSFQISVLPDIRSDIYFEIVGPIAFLSVRTDDFREVWFLIYRFDYNFCFPENFSF
jgi:hypothetical protein